MRISDWSSDVCSSDLGDDPKATRVRNGGRHLGVTDIVHSALNDRMFDPEEFRDAGFDGHVRFLMDRWTRFTAAHRRRLRLAWRCYCGRIGPHSSAPQKRSPTPASLLAPRALSRSGSSA